MVVGVTAGGVALVGMYVFLKGSGDEPPQPIPCEVSITVASSQEKADVLSDLAARYNRAKGCKHVQVFADGSGDVLDSLAHGWKPEEHQGHDVPEVWSPAATVWARMLPKEADGHDRYRVINYSEGRLPSVAQTPVVLAMPETIATKLGWPGRAIGWSTLQQMADDPAKWKKATGGGAGTFKLGKSNPNYATTGLTSLFEAYAVASNTPTQDLTTRTPEDGTVRERVRRVEAATIHYGETSLVYLCNLARADAAHKALGYVSVVPLEEKSVYEYNRGRRVGCEDTHRPHERLVAVHPEEGTLVSDAPYGILSTVNRDQRLRPLAEDFLKFLHESAQQDTIKDRGFRGGVDGELAPKVASALKPADTRMPKVSELPAPEALNAIRRSWQKVRKPARVLLVLDVSGSMSYDPRSQAPPARGNPSRLDQVKAAAKAALADFDAHDEVGLWKFSGDRSTSSTPYSELVAPGPIAATAPRIRDEVSHLSPEHDTALYVTIRAARERRARTAPDAINAVVVLTDGQNFYKPGYGIKDLTKDIDAYGKGRPVRVFTIAYSGNAPVESLLEITRAGGGFNYDSTDPDRIEKVLREVISNF
jgi:Ca-activated chloride channel family protein